MLTVRTKDGKWVVTAKWHGKERVVFRPDPSAHVIAQIRACARYREEHA